MGKQCDILLVGQTPPPLHGQSVVTGMLFDHDWESLKVERLRMAFSDDIEAVGEASWVKVWRLAILTLKTWRLVLTHRPRMLYYLPASPNLTPVVRDVLYLGLVRWLFSKTVFHYHAGGVDEFYRGRVWLRRLTKWVYNRADYSIDVNVTEPPSGEYFQAKNNTVVMNGVDVGNAQRERPIDDVFRILYVGLLCEPKGVLELVAAAAVLKNEGVECEIAMVGGWESSDFKQQFENVLMREGVADMFRMEGVKIGAEKWQAYADADMFVFPSHHPTETFGLVVVEAMAFGLPIVATRWRGIPHVVGKEDGGAILYEVGETEQLAKAVKSVAVDPALRWKMSSANKQRYSQGFTQDKFLGDMKQVFCEVLSNEIE